VAPLKTTALGGCDPTRDDCQSLTDETCNESIASQRIANETYRVNTAEQPARKANARRQATLVEKK